MSALSQMPWFEVVEDTPLGRQILDALKALGSTANEVAQTLANKGCMGVRGSATKCPLAHYLHTQFPGMALSVVGYWVEDSEGHRLAYTPPGAMAFVGHYDGGDCYHDLDPDFTPTDG